MSIRLDNLTVSYRRHPAVHHVSGAFAEGEATAIFGPNGAGKSTLLKTMIGLQQPDHGRVDLGGLSRGNIAYLAQQAEIDRSLPLSVFELVCTGLWQSCGAFGRVDQVGRERVDQALAQVGLTAMAQRQIGALSAGQFQRVLFARILVQDARLILLDEPFNAVDAKTTFELLALVQRWREEKRTVIAVLHDYEQVRAYFPQTLLLAREVVAWGATEQVLTDTNLQKAMMQAMHWQEHAPVCEVDAV